MTAEYQIRRGTEADWDFLLLLHEKSMRPHVEAQFGTWEPKDQEERFRATTDPSEHQILLVQDKPVGCALTKDEGACVRLIRLYLMPEHQNRGIGSRFLENLCREADTSQKLVCLRVLRVNRVAGLYERFGFEFTDETETHINMQRPPSSA